MTILYNCRHDGDEYRISKFDNDMNVESSYTLSLEECTCPAGVRPTCRHRTMLPKFIARGHVGDEWFFDFDRGGWVQMGEEWIELSGLQEEQILMGFHNLPDGVTAIVMDHPDKVVDVHNAIAEAVGEPEGFSLEMQAALEADGEKLKQLTGEDHGPVFLEEPPSPTHIPRRF